jgi:hypothetical protein
MLDVRQQLGSYLLGYTTATESTSTRYAFHQWSLWQWALLSSTAPCGAKGIRKNTAQLITRLRTMARSFSVASRSAASRRHSDIFNNTKSHQRHPQNRQVNKQVKDQAITTTSHEARERTSLVSNAHGICLEKQVLGYIQVHQWHPSSGQIISQSANHPHHEQNRFASDPEDIHPIVCQEPYRTSRKKHLGTDRKQGKKSCTHCTRSSRNRRCNDVCVDKSTMLISSGGTRCCGSRPGGCCRRQGVLMLGAS